MDFFQEIIKEEAEEDKIAYLETNTGISVMGDEGCKFFINEEELRISNMTSRSCFMKKPNFKILLLQSL